MKLLCCALLLTLVAAFNVSCTHESFAPDSSRAPSSTDKLSFGESLSAETLTRVKTYVARDLALAASEKHATLVHLQTDSEGHPIKTGKTVLLIHGLFESPAWMKTQSDLAYSLGYNVISLRLEGHFEKARRALDHALMDHWIQQTNEAADLALELGGKIIGIGHSTGALLLSQVAALRAGDVPELFLISPAFSLTKIERDKAYWLTKFRIPGWPPEVFKSAAPNSRYLSAWAGWQVALLTDKVRTLQAEPDALPFDFLVTQLARTRVTAIDTAIDRMVDIKATANFIARLEASRIDAFNADRALKNDLSPLTPPAGQISRQVIPANFNLTHGEMTTATDSEGYLQYTAPALLALLRGQASDL